MVLKPCPCMTLQKGTMLLSIIDAMLSMVNIGLTIISLVAYLSGKEDITKSEKNVGVVVFIVTIIIFILQILLAFRLYRGATQKDYRNCRIWMIITTIIVIINIISLILNSTAGEFDWESFMGTSIVVLYKLYEMLVVYAFLQELQQEGTMLAGVVFSTVAYPQQPYTTYNNGPIFTTTQSQPYPPPPAYPMQQFTPQVTVQAYPPPVHHVSTR